MKKRREFIKLLGTVGSLTFLPTITGCFDQIRTGAKSLRKNDKLKTIKEGYQGNATKGGAFQNLYGVPASKGLWDVLKWRFSANPQQEEKDKEEYALKVIKNKKILHDKEDYICWLGHASFLIQIDGKKLLTDPCLTTPPFVDRHSDLPFEIGEIKPDYLLISHGHFDHLDSDSITFFDHALALIPLDMAPLIKGMNSTIKTQEAGWFQQYDIDEEFKIFFLPAQHWYKRSAVDTDEVLWGSFMIQTREKQIYFAGDTGYSDHFKEVGKLFGSIDIALMPIGAYRPRYFMKNSHMSPQDALKASKDLGAKRIVPMHFGTFDLTDEPRGEPERIFRKIGKDENLRFLDVGEKMLI